ncbi:MAG TPA: branched-chain amino acid transaminase [Chloroflexota bacterium]|nr:branched-chain amino acid transaminase [Chloroflexota bacterium]
MEVQGVAFFEGEYRPLAEARVNVMTHAFNYGTGVFEGIRGYWNAAEEQIYIFRAREHFERLHRSARIMAIDLPYSVEELCRICGEIVRRSGFQQDVYIRPIAYKCGLGIGVSMTGVTDDCLIYCQPMGNYIEVEHGIRCCVSTWRRTGDNAIPPRAKVTGAYANAALAKHEALTNGYDEAILLTDAGNVSEGSAENLFIVKNRTLFTPPPWDNVLEGITRATLMDLARAELGVQSMERTIQRTELYTADEVFLCGTGAQISPVVEIDHRPIGDGRIGPLTSALQRLYFDTVRGVNRAYAAWLQPVYDQIPAHSAA